MAAIYKGAEEPAFDDGHWKAAFLSPSCLVFLNLGPLLPHRELHLVLQLHLSPSRAPGSDIKRESTAMA